MYSVHQNGDIAKRRNVMRKVRLCYRSGVLMLGLVAVLWMPGLAEAQPGPWWDDSWPYRKEIEIPASSVPSDLTNFPVLISLNDADLTKAQADGDDLVFTDYSGAQLDHEIESFASGDLQAWVRVPLLSGSSDTVLYLYYGNLASGNQENPTAVWDASYKMVHHLQEASGTLFDSTVNANDSTAVSGVTQGIAAQINGGVDFATGKITVAHHSSLDITDVITFEAWIKPDTLPGTPYRNLLIKGSNPNFTYQFYLLQSTADLSFFSDVSGPVPSGTPVTAGVWQHVAVSVDEANSTAVFYINGTPVATTTANFGASSSVGVQIGSFNTTNYFDGAMDEIRISQAVRSDDWIATSYANQDAPSSFYSVGLEEEAPLCGNSIVETGEDCDDGNTADGDCCSSTCQYEAVDSPCGDLTETDCDHADSCDGAGTCLDNIEPDATPCDDGLYCTVGESCLSGVCTGSPRDCSALDDQCNTGVCDEGSDACVKDPAPNEGDACDDGLFCTVGETCSAGTCQGGVNPCTEPLPYCNEDLDVCEASAGPVTNLDTTKKFPTIQAAIDDPQTLDGHTLEVEDGSYVGNVIIDKNVRLVSVNGRAVTAIVGVSDGSALGTVVVQTGSNGVEIGAPGKGFEIVGIDNGNPGVENAAVYFQGNHAGAKIIDNEIVANGDAGLITEYGATIDGFLIDENVFSGQTFFSPPAGDGFTQQFTLPNVPRQLVVMGCGSGCTNTSNITFTDNVISGTAGGINASLNEQGNTLVTIDAATVTVTGNSFEGTTTRYGSSLRARGSDTTISGNSFFAVDQTATTNFMYLASSGGALSIAPDGLVDMWFNNTFDTGVAFVDGGDTIFIGTSIQGFVDGFSGGVTLRFTGDYAETVDINKNTVVGGVFELNGSITASVTGAGLDAGFSPGIVTTGDLTLTAGSIMKVEINGLLAGTDHAQYVVNGAVDLGGSTLNAFGTITASLGDAIVFIANDGADAVTGQFAGLSQGGIVTVNGENFAIRYDGGDGNDVALVRVPTPLSPIYVDDDFTGTPFLTDPDGAGPAQFYGVDSFDNIQDGADAVAVGGSVLVAPGSYSENVSVGHRAIIDGSGSGSDPGVDTVVTAAAAGAPVFTIDGDNAGGASASDRLELRDMRVTGATGGGNAGSGIRIDGSISASYMTFENIAAVSNEGNGIAVNHTGAVEDIAVTQCDLSDNGGTGFRIASAVGSFNGLTMTGGQINDNGISGLTTGPSGSPNVTGIVIDGTSFSGNGDALASSGSGSGDISLFLFNGDATIQNVTITGDDAHVGIQVRGSDTYAPIGNVSLNNVSITGSYQHPSTWVGSGLFISGYTDLSGLSMSNVSIDVTEVSVSKPVINLYTDILIGDVNIGDTVLGGNASADILHVSTGAMDATSATFTGAAGNFEIEDRVAHVVDFPGVGLVTWVAGNLYVTPNSFAPPTTLTPDIQRAVDAASPGEIVNVAAGLYENQVIITKDNVQLLGSGSGGDPGVDTIIQSPTSLAVSFMTSQANFPIVLVQGVDGVVIDGVRVDGAGRGNSNYRFVGIGFDDAGGTVSNSAIVEIRDTPISGAQHGVGILASATAGTPRTLNLSNTAISGFQKNGTVFAGSNLTTTASGNTVIGAGAISFTAQNGIQVGPGGTADLIGNTVSGFAYTPATYASAGILVWGPDGLITTSGNNVAECQVGIWYITASGSIVENTVTHTLAGMGATPFWWSIVSDPGEGTPPQPPADPFDVVSGPAPAGPAPAALLSTNVDRNAVDCGGNGAGIEADALGTDTLDFSATENVVSNCAYGFALYQDTGATLNATVFNNSADLSNTVALDNSSGVLQNASGNWWGDNDPAVVAGRFTTGPVDYTPWLDVGTDTSADPGFQGDFSTLDVDDDSPQTGPDTRIIEAIGLVTASTVNVAAGTYVESGQIVVDKDLAIIGDINDRPVVMTDQDTGTSGDSRGWWLVEAGNVLDVANMVFDGTGYKVYQAFRQRGSGSFDNCAFKEIKFNESGPTYAGVALAAFGDGPVDVLDCTFEEIGRVGVLYFGTGVAGAVYSGNVYTGKGIGDFLDYAIDLSAGATAVITENLVSGCRGVASSDGSTSAGYLISTYFGSGTEAVLTHNTILDNTTGIYAGYDSTDTSLVTANLNTIAGNDNGIINPSATTIVDAELNWWGDASGPNDPAGTIEVDGPGDCTGTPLDESNVDGLGDSVSDRVDYCPWLNAPATLSLATSDSCLKIGELLTTSIELTLSKAAVLSGDFYFDFDTANLDFVGVSPASGEPFTNVSVSSDEPGGTIHATAAVPPGTPGSTGDATMAVLTLLATGEICNGTGMVGFSASPLTSLETESAGTIVPMQFDLGTVTIDSTAPVITCPADIEVDTDPGEPGADVNVGTATASDNCDLSPAILGTRSDALPLTDPYPIGTTFITWTATDDCGNVGQCTQSVVVNAVLACSVDDDCNDADACTFDECVTAACANTPRLYGDANGDGVRNLFDVFCILDGIGGDFSSCAKTNADLHPCSGNDTLNVFDVFAVLDAISGADDCGCGTVLSSPGVTGNASGRDLSRRVARGLRPAEISLVPVRQSLRRGSKLVVDVFVEGAVGIRGYELKIRPAGEGADAYRFEGATVDVNRPDFVFIRRDAYSATDVRGGRLVCVAIDENGVQSSDGYLGTFTFRAPRLEPRREFEISLSLDEDSFLLNAAGELIPLKSEAGGSISAR